MPKERPNIIVKGDYVDYKHVDYQIGDVAENGIGVQIINGKEEGSKRQIPTEELFRFVAPGLEDDEKLKVHRQVKDLVARFSLVEIGNYMKKLEQEGKIYIKNANLDRLHEELVRLGMPDYSEKGFSEPNFKKNIRP